ncbi:MAG: alpha/beta family hydrolase [Hyphomicrobiales bacterium]
MEYLFDGPPVAPFAVVLAHGAGAPMDSPFMEAFARGLGQRGFRVARFEFPYMAARRTAGTRKPPDREAVLLETWRAVAEEFGGGDRLVVGGKSMGGRMASMVADEVGARGLLCLGYPFHAPGRPEKARTAHLAQLRTPALIVQGTRDPFGGVDEVAGYDLSPAITVHWLEDGDHDFKPRKTSGRSQVQNWDEGIAAAAGFLERL